MTFKTEMWAEYGDLRRNEIEEDIIFDETNVEDFEESIALCAEKKWWKEEEKLEQVMTRVDSREYENMKKIKEESDTWGRFLVKFRRTYTLAIQKQKKRQLLQEQGLWIGRRGDKLERKTRKKIDEDDVPLRQVLDRKRTTIQKRNESASKTTRVQKKRRNEEKKQSEEEEKGEREHDMMRAEEGKKEMEEVAKEKEGTKKKKKKKKEGEKRPDMVSGEEGKKEVAKEKEDNTEKEKEEE
ncbi:hypothetical protein CBR_g31290 [Chara braunii]|uniref:Uncharacterized protein n=1 Tax=Chara braunii TaxID=69332 RepID=A0A388LEJ9_CHABU|nr:hypothetical protein CBR_g31290 [Chara braunii]|eukprot:GBG80735.1 hypothetical protein CBR_g31290 [Chara braunii]